MVHDKFGARRSLVRERHYKDVLQARSHICPEISTRFISLQKPCCDITQILPIGSRQISIRTQTGKFSVYTETYKRNSAPQVFVEVRTGKVDVLFHTLPQVAPRAQLQRAGVENSQPEVVALGFFMLELLLVKKVRIGRVFRKA